MSDDADNEPGSGPSDGSRPDDEAPIDTPTPGQGDQGASANPSEPPTSENAAGAAQDAAAVEVEDVAQDTDDGFYGGAARPRLGAGLAVGGIVLIALLAALIVFVAGGDEDEADEESSAPIDTAAELQAQVRRFADAWVAGDVEAAAPYAAVCLEEVGQVATEELLDLTLDAIEAFQGVPRDQLSVRRVVTREVSDGTGQARIDLDPGPFDDPLEAVGLFLPWRQSGERWLLDTCTFGAGDDEELPEGAPRRAEVIRAMAARGYAEELSICVADALIAEVGLAELNPTELSDEQEALRIASEALCRSAPALVGGAAGTPDDPIPFGAVGRVGEWELSVTDVVADANTLVMDAFDFNDPPAEGEQFVLVRLELTYRGEQPGATLLDLGFRVEAQGGRTYDEFDDTCGLFPDEIDQVAETPTGETRSGTMCWSVATDDVASLRLLVDSLVTLDDPKLWFELSG